MNARFFAVAGALLAFTAVGAGAFGAHALRGRLDPGALAIFETAARYHLVHSVALFAVAWANTQWPGRMAQVAGWLFIAGIVLFSGSLYLLALGGANALGAVAPVGGICLLVGWLLLAGAAWRGASRG